MNSTATHAETRQYLVNDNGWSHYEVNDLFEAIGTETRTHAAWEEAIAEYQRREEEGKRKTLTVTIDLEGAAFSDGFADHEAADILQRLARQVREGALSAPEDALNVGGSIILRDVNGNQVGTATVEKVAR